MQRVFASILLLAVTLCSYADGLLNGTAIGGNGWTGLEFGQTQQITRVGWKTEQSKYVLLGIFEGANRADFMDALPLTIIGEESDTDEMNYAQIDCSRGFRYVRFVAPNGRQNNLPEVEFWGQAGKGDDSQLCQLTNLPTVSIHTQDNVLPYDKEHEIDCFISIISDEGKTLLADTALIRERGNFSRSFPKKPYRIKFAHKQKVLGAPAKAKKWTLINNYGDKTLMRNQLAFELSRQFGMPYTPFCAYVDVVLNGEYKGCYQLCDQIEVRKNRVEVTEMTTADNSGEAVTGGYLIEADAYAYDEMSMFWSDNGTGVTIKYPKEDSITYSQATYIQKQYNRMERNWKSHLDLNTFLRHFLVGEVSGNTDTYWSMYMYKQRNIDTLFVGPVWDFDLAFENDNRTYPINELGDYIYRTNGSTTGYLRTLVDKIVVSSSTGKKQLKELWAETRRGGFSDEYMLDYIDEQAALLDQSQRLNFLRWPIMNQYIHQNPRIYGSYEGEVENVRQYIKERIEWMDNKLDYNPSMWQDDACVESGEPKAEKVLRDGQLLILRNGKVYSATGNRVK